MIVLGAYPIHHAEGPYRIEDTFKLRHAAGIYTVFGNPEDPNGSCVDVGQSKNVRKRIENHDRTQCWEEAGYNKLWIAVIYTSLSGLDMIEQDLIRQLNPVCGQHFRP